MALTPELSATVLGDAGGKCVLLAGHRYLAVDYRHTGKAGFIYDIAKPGVVMGVTINVERSLVT